VEGNVSLDKIERLVDSLKDQEDLTIGTLIVDALVKAFMGLPMDELDQASKESLFQLVSQANPDPVFEKEFNWMRRYLFNAGNKEEFVKEAQCFKSYLDM